LKNELRIIESKERFYGKLLKKSHCEMCAKKQKKWAKKKGKNNKKNAAGKWSVKKKNNLE